MDKDIKPAYEAPKVTDHGTLQDLTAATKVGLYADADLPAHTPIAGHLS
jgi:hypothetical protein